jgi:outer membrane protein TolC
VQPSAAAPQVRKLTEDDVVKLALENNLNIRIARFDPQIEDLSVQQARSSYTPNAVSTFATTSSDRPSTNFVTGATGGRLSNDQVQGQVGVEQLLPWGGGRYQFGFQNSRLVNNQVGAAYSPQISSSLTASIQQPLIRNFSIDQVRQQVMVATKNREIADVQLRQSVENTIRGVRNAYWNLAYQIANLDVQRQFLDLARESLRNTQTRVEIGTTPPIDIVAAQAEVATREESVIIAEGQIETAQDTLRTLIFDPAMPDFWTVRVEPTALPPLTDTPVDVEAAVQRALERRTDLNRARKSLESSDINIRYLKNQTLPDVTANFDYQTLGIGGTFRQFQPAPIGSVPTIASQSEIGFNSALSSAFSSEFPTWTASVNVSYPIGTSSVEANLARERLRLTQTQTQLRQQELTVVTQVRQAGRDLQTDFQRVQTGRASRELAVQRLDAEQRKFEAGTSTSFQVFQAQRDLALARNNELRAILDYYQSRVNFETVQEVPVGAGTANIVTAGNVGN